MRIEPASLSEVDALADWWVDLAAEQRSFDSHLRTEENRELIREAIARQTVAETVLVARATDTDDKSNGVEPTAGERLGFVMFSVEAGRYAQDVTRGIIDNLFVDPAYRNSKIGSALLEAAENSLAKANVDVVSLDAMAGNEAARRFYRRHGYEPHRIEFEKVISETTDDSDT